MAKGNRGGKRGITISGSAGTTAQKQNLPDYISSSDKAVRLFLTIEDYTTDREITRQVWVPKSQLSDSGWPGLWITDQKAQDFYTGGGHHSSYRAEWTDNSGRKSSAVPTAKEAAAQAKRSAAFQQGVQSYNALIQTAKAAGVKGVRVGLKRDTLLKKMRAAGLNV